MNAHDPHSFRIHGGCRKAPTRLHIIYSRVLDVVALLFAFFVIWCFFTVILLGA